MSPPAEPDGRQDLHNVCVDEKAAGTGACAQVHLPTGRTCTLELHHEGSCDFVPRDQLDEALARRARRG
jgi:hypothetical protein